MTVPELNVLKATRITAKDMPISMNAASERLHDLAIEWEEHNERFEDINPFFVALREIRDKSLKWQAQEPRVLELEEVDRLEQNEVVWLEDKGIEEIIPAIVVSHGHLYAQQSVCLMIVENPRLWIATFDYRERWRCWTFCPTEEQREATSWEKETEKM